MIQAISSVNVTKSNSKESTPIKNLNFGQGQREYKKPSTVAMLGRDFVMGAVIGAVWESCGLAFSKLSKKPTTGNIKTMGINALFFGTVWTIAGVILRLFDGSRKN